MKNSPDKPMIKCSLMIFLCFLLTSIGHLAWMYHLMTMTSAELSEQVTTVGGYALQAVGIGVFSLLLRYRRISPRTVFIAAVIGYTVFLIPSVLGTDLVGVIAFGWLLSLTCGIIAGYYLYELTEQTAVDHSAVTFGFGYGAATIVSWLLSLIDGGSLYYGPGVLIICLILAVFAILCGFIKDNQRDTMEQKQAEKLSKPQLRTLILLVCGVIFLFSLVNYIGFAFSATKVQGGLRPEFSRLFYSVGLISAGFVTDKSRKYGAVCALAALVIPFVELALRGEPISYSVFWALGYLAFGFYSVYRIILFSDIAKSRDLIYLSGFGLMIGRLGDALGTELNLIFAGHEIISVILAAALSVGAVFLFIQLFQILYVPEASRRKSDQEYFVDFALRHDLSSREREVLRLLLADKTNKEISDVICVSESTVKFHIHNLLSKSGCKNRTELKAVYFAERE